MSVHCARFNNLGQRTPQRGGRVCSAGQDLPVLVPVMGTLWWCVCDEVIKNTWGGEDSFLGKQKWGVVQMWWRRERREGLAATTTSSQRLYLSRNPSQHVFTERPEPSSGGSIFCHSAEHKDNQLYLTKVFSLKNIFSFDRERNFNTEKLQLIDELNPRPPCGCFTDAVWIHTHTHTQTLWPDQLMQPSGPDVMAGGARWSDRV